MQDRLPPRMASPPLAELGVEMGPSRGQEPAGARRQGPQQTRSLHLQTRHLPKSSDLKLVFN